MMAHFWIQRDSGEWTAAELDGSTNFMCADGLGTKSSPRAPETSLTAGAGPGAAAVVRRCRPDGDVWAVMAPSDVVVRVNGWPLSLGLCVLRDKDEIRLGDARPCFFSTERLARVETMAEPSSPACCPRCTLPIVGGTLGVRCPRCGVLHHQTDELPCWYGDEDERFTTCANCDQPVTLGTEYQWTPDGL
jgi:hypothetical protein